MTDRSAQWATASPKASACAAIASVGLVFVLLLTESCWLSPVSGKFPPAPPASVFVLCPGDEIDVKFQFTPELNEQQQTIRPDGKIALQGVGDVTAAGLTPEQLRERLTKLYEAKMKQPVITVIVRPLKNRNVFVGGEVKRPGAVPIDAGLTALEAIMFSGGFNEPEARKTNVIVIRYAGDKRYATSVDLKKALKSPESDPFYLAPRDIVYVPSTAITNIDRWVDQYINKLLPNPGGVATSVMSAKP